MVSRVLHEEKNDSAGAGGRNALRVFSAFARIGPPIVDHAEPVLFRRGALTLRVGESAWLTELSFLSEQIRTRMNTLLGRELVKEVRLRLGPLERPPATPPRKRPIPPEARARIREWASAITDDELREAVVRAAERHAANPKEPMPDVSGPPGPRRTPASVTSEPQPMSYGFGDKPRDRWKKNKPKW